MKNNSCFTCFRDPCLCAEEDEADEEVTYMDHEMSCVGNMGYTEISGGDSIGIEIYSESYRETYSEEADPDMDKSGNELDVELDVGLDVGLDVDFIYIGLEKIDNVIKDILKHIKRIQLIKEKKKENI